MTNTTPPTLLIIDDHVTNLKVAMEYLALYSFKILIARDAESGIARAELAQPQLILLDIELPGIDGVEACRRLKANPQTAAIPIMLMTVLSDTADKVRGLEAGAVDYITKPFEAAELLARVQTHLTLRRLQTGLEELVIERTAALAEEIEQRKRSQAEKELLLELVRQQSEQLRQLIQHSVDSQQQRDQELRQHLHDDVEDKLAVAESCLLEALQLLPSAAANPGMINARQQIDRALALLADTLQHTRHVTTDLNHETADRRDTRNNPLLKLTTREYEVLQLLTEGKTSAEIAEILVVTKSTVSTYRKRIMQKLAIRDMPALVKLVLKYQPPA